MVKTLARVFILLRVGEETPSARVVGSTTLERTGMSGSTSRRRQVLVSPAPWATIGPC